MKKKSLKVLLCSTLLAMALTVYACGEKDAGKDSAEVSSEKETQQEQEEKEVEKEESEPVKSEDAEPITEKFPDIKSYVESDLVQEQLDAQLSSLGDSGMSMEKTTS